MATHDSSASNQEQQDVTAPTQPSLLDDLDLPVPFSLTARARRVVAPESLPNLAVVPVRSVAGSATVGDGVDWGDDEPIAFAVTQDVTAAVVPAGVPGGVQEDHDDLDDPRRARARALRRAGAGVTAIAHELTVDLPTVARWTDDVAPAPKAVVRHRVAQRHEQRDLPVAYVTGRAAARSAWRRGSPAVGAAMAAGMAEVTPFAVRLRGELAAVRGVLQWLRDSQNFPDSVVRAQVQAAPSRSMDVVAHDVAAQLALDPERVHARAWVDAPDEDALEVVVRIGDPRLAGTIDGWRQELLEDLVASTGGDAPAVAV